MPTQIIRRALLYVPASSEKFLEKSRSMNVDTVVYDLEDSVAPDKKSQARQTLAQFLASDRPLHIREIAVRINGLDTGYAVDDLNTILKSPNLDTLVIPKVSTAADLEFVTTTLRNVLPDRHPVQQQATSSTEEHYPNDDKRREPIRLLPLIETPLGILNLSSICTSSPYISGLVFAAEDFTLATHITRTEGLPELAYARSALVTAAHAYKLPSAIDLVCVSYKGDDGMKRLEDECRQGYNMGFNGKQCIHPMQVETVERVFGPDEDGITWAVRVIVGNEQAKRGGKGSWQLDGEMIDKPVVSRAQGIIDQAKACGGKMADLVEKEMKKQKQKQEGEESSK